MTGPRMKFCEGIVSGLNGAESYRGAYPRATVHAAEVGASRLLRNAEVSAEIARLRAVAEQLAGSAVLTLIRKRLALAAIVESPGGYLNGKKVLTSDVIAAVKLDAALAGEGRDAEAVDYAADALGQLLARIRK